MRLFIAVRFSPPVMDMLGGAIEALRRQGRGSFTHPENLHLTLAFIGESNDVAGITSAMRAAAKCPPLCLAVGGSGRFGNLHWIGVDKNDELSSLAASLREALEAGGISFDEKPFKPHITLAREYRSTSSAPPQIPAPRTEMRVEALSLMRSDRVGGKLVYTEIARVPLAGKI
ncbi:MAG TPA: RNA 2',3'-cyclic phosphodiesterase [Candidatus Acidoferrum sp.]|nr:RNA 2',3'-cyclic phosphodiesterase [Candidatus Acidoferrum sp.]